ncbi:MAG: hypothetical protein HKN04_14395 [Rhodothermaceae bacterium]|nr:hypothetical protein [Rhodothermaceae bacterium]
MTSSTAEQRLLYVDTKNAIIGGVVTALVIGAILLLVGVAGGWKAKVLLESTMPTTRFLCSAVMTVSATTLALMLTLLGLSNNIDGDLKAAHFERIRQIALIDVIAFIGATVLLLAHTIPFGEDLGVAQHVYVIAYYSIMSGAALLGGTLVAMILMLYDAVRDLVQVFCSDKESDLLVDSEGGREEERSDGRMQRESA